MATVTTTTTATAVQLNRLEAEGVSRRNAPSSVLPEDSSTQDDPILQASRLADADVPDGGYGWAVIFACATVTWWTVGFSYSWGILQREFVEDGLSTPGTLAFVGSVGSCLNGALAIFGGRLVRTLGAQTAGLLGVGLVGLALLLSSFSTKNLGGLFFCTGVILGAGKSLSYMMISVIPAQYFSRRRGLANGIVLAGGGVGGAITSLALEALVQRLGPAWAYRVLGFATLATGIPAALVIKERVPVRSSGFVEWSLFKNPSFVLIIFTGFIGMFPSMVPPVFLPLYSRSIGLSPGTGAGLLAGFNFASAMGRVICGLLCDKLGALNTLFLSFMLSAITMLVLWPASATVGPLAVFVVLQGIANGGFFATMPTVVGNVFGSARVSVAMGVVVTSWSAGYLLGSPIAGYLLDAYGGPDKGLQAYRPAMFYAGSMAAGAGILVGVMRFRASKSPRAKI